MKFLIQSFLILCIISWENALYAQIDYKPSAISQELKNNSKAVVRLDETVINISSTNRATYKKHIIITILNENGRDLEVLQLPYDKFSSVSNIECYVFDVNGKKIKKVPKDEIYDFSFNSYAGYEDNRYKMVDPEIRTYPFTIDYSFEISQSFLINIPGWQLYNDYNIAIEKSIFRIVADNESLFRYYEKNITNPVKKSNINGKIEYAWEYSNIPALKSEPFSYDISDYTPSIEISPNEFRYNSLVGNMNSWQDFGLWLYNLNKDRDALPEETQEKIKQMVASAQNDVDKVKILYKYLQSNTRYVSEQIGIGGWQTFEAERVNKLGYGDCKALTNYMKALLKVVGIESNYTLIYADAYPPIFNKEFPSNKFNHVILFVPLPEDTLWLECTNQTAICGSTRTATDDREALVISENGGLLVHKPGFDLQDNSEYTRANIIMDESGNGKGELIFHSKGSFYENVKAITMYDDKDKKKALYSSINIPNFTITGFSFNGDSSKNPTMETKINVDIANYATKMGSNSIFTLNLNNKIEVLPKKVENRQSDIVIRRSRIEIDTICYSIPENMTLSALPNKIELNSEFGKYTAEAVFSNGKLTYIRTIQFNKGVYPKEDYPKLVEFFAKITDADQKKIAMKPQ